MPHRAFEDRRGIKWDVWTVHPTKVERRLNEITEAEVAIDRRRETEYRVALGPALSQGWLCFESSNEKRRLAPIPDCWDTCSDDELQDFLDQAKPVGKPRRLI